MWLLCAKLSLSIWITSFVTANHTVNSRGKLPKNRTVIKKLSFEGDALSLPMAAQFLRCRRRSSLVLPAQLSAPEISVDYSPAYCQICRKQVYLQHKSKHSFLHRTPLTTYLPTDSKNRPAGELICSLHVWQFVFSLSLMEGAYQHSNKCRNQHLFPR